MNQDIPESPVSEGRQVCLDKGVLMENQDLQEREGLGQGEMVWMGYQENLDPRVTQERQASQERGERKETKAGWGLLECLVYLGPQVDLALMEREVWLEKMESKDKEEMMAKRVIQVNRELRVKKGNWVLRAHLVPMFWLLNKRVPPLKR